MARGPAKKGVIPRAPIQTRVSYELRDKITAAAEAAGRSVAQQVELMLEKAFEDRSPILEDIENLAKKIEDSHRMVIEKTQQVMIESCGGDSIFPLWRVPAAHIMRIEAKTGKSIREDEDTRREAERAVLGAITDVFRNLPPPLSETVKARSSVTAPDADFLAGPAYKRQGS